jgi:hypothetical protein
VSASVRTESRTRGFVQRYPVGSGASPASWTSTR